MEPSIVIAAICAATLFSCLLSVLIYFARFHRAPENAKLDRLEAESRRMADELTQIDNKIHFRGRSL